eukprot:scaffold5529_cov117-Cylindrotheca_fusiformis.AAC.36
MKWLVFTAKTIGRENSTEHFVERPSKPVVKTKAGEKVNSDLVRRQESTNTIVLNSPPYRHDYLT